MVEEYRKNIILLEKLEKIENRILSDVYNEITSSTTLIINNNH